MGQQIRELRSTGHSSVSLANVQIRYRLVSKLRFNLIFSKAEK